MARTYTTHVSHEIRDSKFRLKVYFKTDAKFIETDVKTKLKDFTLLAMQEFKLDQEKPENVRLRVYKPQEDQMTDTFTGMDERELLYLGVAANKAFALERKADHESFQDFDPLLIKIKCYLWEEGVISSDSDHCKAIYVSISRKRPIQDLEESVRQILSIPHSEYFFIFKRRVINDNLKEAMLLNSAENLLYSLEEMKVYEASKLLIERLPECLPIPRPESLEQFSEEMSRWVDVVERENFTLLIRFNLPSLTPNSEMAQFDQELLIDSRLSLEDLKRMISESMEVETDKFIMRRGGKVGIELTDLSKSLVKAGLVSGSVIYTAFGTPTKPGEMLLKLLMTIKADSEVSHHYDLKPMVEIAIDQNSTAEQVIEKAVQVYRSEGGNDLAASTFRLREKHSRSLIKVYRDVSIKKQGVFEGKQLVLENIDPAVQVAKLESRQTLLVVQLLNPETVEFEEVFELAVDRNDSLAAVAQRVFERCPKIPLEFMEAAKVTTVWGLDRLYGLNLPYAPLHDSKQLLAGQPFFIGSDGVVLL